MDEILDMIEQEQLSRAGLGSSSGGDEEDDKNIDEILAYINKQQPSPQQQQGAELESEYSLPEEADAEFEAMVRLQQQQQSHPYANQHHYQQQSAHFPPPQHYPTQPPYGGAYSQQQPVNNDSSTLTAGLQALNLKGLSASSAPFVPRNAPHS